MNRAIHGLLTVGLAALSASTLGAPATGDSLPALEPYITPLVMHPVDESMYTQPQQTPAGGMPSIIRQGASPSPDKQQIPAPIVTTPAPTGDDDAGGTIGKAGTGFFIGDDGILLTAAHVANGCARMQIISKFIARTWVSLVATDQLHDIAILKAPGARPPGVMHLASAAPTSGKFAILGFPASASIAVAAETSAVLVNDRFPPNIGPLANPRDLLWMSAPEVSRGYSGGPIFDARTGAVVGLVKGEVDGGYLRLIHGMPTTGIAIGPGVGQIGAIVRREAPSAAASLVSWSGDAGMETLRRATVHVLCWHY